MHSFHYDSTDLTVCVRKTDPTDILTLVDQKIFNLNKISEIIHVQYSKLNLGFRKLVFTAVYQLKQ